MQILRGVMRASIRKRWDAIWRVRGGHEKHEIAGTALMGVWQSSTALHLCIHVAALRYEVPSSAGEFETKTRGGKQR